jgi:hypothetical protein
MSQIKLPKEIHITDVERIEMYDIELSNDVVYKATINGRRVINKTDGMFVKHVTLEAWVVLALISYIEQYNKPEGPQCKPGTGKTVIYDPKTGKTYTPENEGGEA